MSFRNMLKVSFLMLLAMALAATNAHARLDLFGHQLLNSKSQPDPNYEEAEMLKSATTKEAEKLMKAAAVVQEEKPSSSKVKADTIPYSECQETCNYTCACTLIWPPELSQCICAGSSKLSTTKAAEKLHKELDLVSKPVAKLEGSFLPYPECIEKCDECVICTRVYPIEAAYCYCGMNPSIQKSGIALPI